MKQQNTARDWRMQGPIAGQEKVTGICRRVIAGADTPEISRRVENFFQSVVAIFEAAVKRAQV